MRIRWQGRITVDAERHHGEPCITGTRVPVATIVGSIADGMTPVEVVEQYPQLAVEDVQAALAYAADVLRSDPLLPIPA
ncbi:MAG TPA: DUF433 domain-containing protein [Armatimonadota bacterium]|nr:DUF433 domain-containing protein [Armatimonadota bacterium]